MWHERPKLPASIRLVALTCFLQLSLISCDIRIGEPPTEVSFSALATVDGKELAFPVSESDLRDTPDWAIGQELPLSLEEAAKIARDEIQKYTENAEGWTLDGINLQKHSTNKWFFLIHFQRTNQWAFSHDFLNIPVLLNGKAVRGSPTGNGNHYRGSRSTLWIDPGPVGPEKESVSGS